jgi:hypothetical protein
LRPDGRITSTFGDSDVSGARVRVNVGPHARAAAVSRAGAPLFSSTLAHKENG